MLASSDHYHEALHCIEFRLCRKDECNIYKIVERHIQTPIHVTWNDIKNILKELTQHWMI